MKISEISKDGLKAGGLKESDLKGSDVFKKKLENIDKDIKKLINK